MPIAVAESIPDTITIPLAYEGPKIEEAKEEVAEIEEEIVIDSEDIISELDEEIKAVQKSLPQRLDGAVTDLTCDRKLEDHRPQQKQHVYDKCRKQHAFANICAWFPILKRHHTKAFLSRFDIQHSEKTDRTTLKTASCSSFFRLSDEVFVGSSPKQVR